MKKLITIIIAIILLMATTGCAGNAPRDQIDYRIDRWSINSEDHESGQGYVYTPAGISAYLGYVPESVLEHVDFKSGQTAYVTFELTSNEEGDTYSNYRVWVMHAGETGIPTLQETSYDNIVMGYVLI